MYSQKQPNDSYRFFERYTDYMTGKTKTVSVTLDRNTPQARKQAADMLHDKISARQHVKDTVNYTLRDLVDEYLAYKKTRSKGSYYRNIYSILNTTVDILGADILINHLTAVYIREQLEVINKKHATLNNYIKKLKASIRWGYKKNMVTDVSFIDEIDTCPYVIRLCNVYKPRFSVYVAYIERNQLTDAHPGQGKKFGYNVPQRIVHTFKQFLKLVGLQIFVLYF